MRLAIVRHEGRQRLGLIEDDHVVPLDLSQVENCRSLSDILHAPDPLGLGRFLVDRRAGPLPLDAVQLLAPVDRQEIWAAGVTYQRSQVARMEESETGASHYDRVYTADRPELFFKSLPEKVCGPGEPLRVRADSRWTVPEPELALVISPDLRLAGFTIGNDMSARDIEGENPLYLPQAKVYRQSCGLGPCVFIPEEPLDRAGTTIRLAIARGGSTIFEGSTSLGQMARGFDDLIAWLGRDNEFPHGAILLTGTGVVPPDDFTLEGGESVSIEITGIGTLTNPIVKTD
ncbi:MAG: fumarylacetoacetate hydrolase family protein [Planctomycetaceae bacterium]